MSKIIKGKCCICGVVTNLHDKICSECVGNEWACFWRYKFDDLEAELTRLREALTLTTPSKENL